jgi:flagellin
MAFQVNSNVAALNVYNNLSVHQAKSSASLARISSGLKAAGGGDIASQGTAATLNAANQATQSSISQVQSAINRLQAADAALGETIALAQKGVEIASRGTDAGADLTALHAALTANSAGIASIRTNTQFNGTVLNGTAVNVDVGVDTISAGISITVTPTFTAAPTVAALTTVVPSEITTTLTAYNTFVETSVNNRASNAGNLASLQNTLQVLNSVAANELAGIGQAQDTDIAKEMMHLTSANIMTEAATAMLAQAMQLPNSVLKLLQ